MHPLAQVTPEQPLRKDTDPLDKDTQPLAEHSLLRGHSPPLAGLSSPSRTLTPLAVYTEPLDK